MTKRAMAATKREMAMASRVAGDKDGDGKGGKGNGDNMAMATATRWQAAKRAMMRAARVIATTMRIVGDKEGDARVARLRLHLSEGAEKLNKISKAGDCEL
jgi:hypothetical protein